VKDSKFQSENKDLRMIKNKRRSSIVTRKSEPWAKLIRSDDNSVVGNLHHNSSENFSKIYFSFPQQKSSSIDWIAEAE
jgi:hypothetical protein